MVRTFFLTLNLPLINFAIWMLPHQTLLKFKNAFSSKGWDWHRDTLFSNACHPLCKGKHVFENSQKKRRFASWGLWYTKAPSLVSWIWRHFVTCRCFELRLHALTVTLHWGWMGWREGENLDDGGAGGCGWPPPIPLFWKWSQQYDKPDNLTVVWN